MRRSWTLVVITLAGCGIADNRATDSDVPLGTDAAPVDAPLASSPPVVDTPTSSPSAFDLISAEGTQLCDFGIIRSSYDAIVVVDDVELGDVFVTRTGTMLPTLRTFGEPQVLEIEGDRDVPEPSDADRSRSMVVIYPGQGFTEADAITAAIGLDDPVLFVTYLPNGVDQVDQYLLAVGSMEDDGSITLLGSCGADWSGWIAAAARLRGSVAGPEFYAELAVPYSEAMEQVAELSQTGPSLEERWEASAPAERSLDYRDIPRAHLERFSLTGMNVALEGEVPEGYVIVRSPEGVMATFAVPAVSGVLPIMIPDTASVVEVLFTSTPFDTNGAEPLTDVAAEGLDAEVGIELMIVADPERGLRAELGNMAPGRLESVLGTTREGIDELRARLLAERTD